MQNKYEFLASEYYDPMAHPTCANFRELSVEFVRRHVSNPNGKTEVLEVGAGNSVAAEVLSDFGQNLEYLTITDESESMLAHSQKWSSQGATLKRASATDLPFPSRSFDLIVSSLGDPYNDHVFWRQCSRVLKHGGRVLFSTPSFDWAREFRLHADHDRAEFEIRCGATIEVDSFVYPLSEQIEMIHSVGLAVDIIDFFYTGDIHSPISAKLECGQSTIQAPVVWGIVATKPAT